MGKKASKKRDRHEMELDPLRPNLTWLEVVAVYNENRPPSEKKLTKNTAIRVHDEALFKLRLKLRDRGVFYG